MRECPVAAAIADIKPADWAAVGAKNLLEKVIGCRCRQPNQALIAILQEAESHLDELALEDEHLPHDAIALIENVMDCVTSALRHAQAPPDFTGTSAAVLCDLPSCGTPPNPEGIGICQACWLPKAECNCSDEGG